MTVWTSIISDLRAVGMTHAEIAKAADSKASTIADLGAIEDRQPRYTLGVRLLELHSELTKQNDS